MLQLNVVARSMKILVDIGGWKGGYPMNECDIGKYQKLTLLDALKIHFQMFFALKIVSATFLVVCFLSHNKSTCQTRKNVFYFTSEALFVLKKIRF